ncbi:MAG: cytochrome B [Legionellales bacterium]|nr:cytochrome B [Legionellales bacterium]|tara:strand:+ start:3751 stop:4749 length:999 start_codon:yes stop_codon:yes gene_type:complete
MINCKLKTILGIFLIWGVITVLLGAYTRISDAGLGCPDWPGCFGQWIAPTTDLQLSEAKMGYVTLDDNTPLKAWLEMIHRYAASFFGSFLICLGIYIIFNKQYLHKRWTGFMLIALVVFQALLGMWTVTWKLHPLVVMGHLMGGLSLSAILCWLYLDASTHGQKLFVYNPSPSSKWVGFGVFVIIVQLVLGGWTSATYSGPVCPTFPYCEGSYWPQMNFLEGFFPLVTIGQNYQGGVFSHSARVAIQMVHRYWAFVVTIYLIALSWFMMKRSVHNMIWIIAVMSALFLQILVGVLNVWWYLPISLAVLHNGLALLILLLMVGWYHTVQKKVI